MSNFILTFSFLLIGFLLKHSKQFPEQTAQVLNLFVIYVSLPALILLNIPQLEFTDDLAVVVVIPWLILVISVLLVLFFSKLFNWDRQTLAVLLLLVPLGNTSFLGIPMVQAYYGKQAVAYALIYDQFGSFFALALYGSIILALYNEESKGFSLKVVIHKILIFPPFIALLTAILYSFFETSLMLTKVITPLAETLVPVVMVAVGYQLQLSIDRKHISAFIVGLSLKMIAAPFIVALLLYGFEIKRVIYQVTIFESAMPPMISVGALAIMSGFNAKLTAAMLAYGILFAFISLPILHMLI